MQGSSGNLEVVGLGITGWQRSIWTVHCPLGLTSALSSEKSPPKSLPLYLLLGAGSLTPSSSSDPQGQVDRQEDTDALCWRGSCLGQGHRKGPTVPTGLGK